MALSLDDIHRLLGEGFTTFPIERTWQLDRETPVSIYQRLQGRAFCLLESAQLGEDTGRYSFIGLDRQWRLEHRDGRTLVTGTTPPPPDARPLSSLRALLARYRTYQPPGLVGLIGGAIGFVSYDYVRLLEKLPNTRPPSGWPDVDFSFPGAVMIIDHLRHSTTAVVLVHVEDTHDVTATYERAISQLDELEELLVGPAPAVDVAVEKIVATAPHRRGQISIREIAASLSNFSEEEYCAVVDRAQQHIVAGDIFQVVPSQQFRRPTIASPLTMYRVLRALNPSPYMYLIDVGTHHLVGASPEMLVKVSNRQITTRPIAGTRPRGTSDIEDRRLEAELLADEKEIAEHVMLVDLGRNDVGRVAQTGSVQVEGLAHIERYSHLMHLVSQVTGTLRDDLDAFDAFDALFPAGTLSGAPKVRAMEIIDTAEPVMRGPYGGAVGYFSLTGDADFAITIRTIGLRDGWATVQAGGGVVADSRGSFEYQECISKASAPLLALEIGDPVRPAVS